MSLIDDIKDWYKEESYPPYSGDIEGVDRVSNEVIDSSPRWGNTIRVVFKREDEYVAVQDIEPATEMQDWGDYGEPDVYVVEPYEVTVVQYRRVAQPWQPGEARAEWVDEGF